MKPFEIIKDIFIVGGPEITDGRDGCVYLINLGELILIDTGAGWSVDKIVNNIHKLGFNSKDLNKILLTHCHIDHIGGVPEIKKRFGAKIYIHKLCRRYPEWPQKRYFGAGQHGDQDGLLSSLSGMSASESVRRETTLNGLPTLFYASSVTDKTSLRR
jgi:glyoxylase-like metal-dependent hydrolase (beta-lactamase superfamily II)